GSVWGAPAAASWAAPSWERCRGASGGKQYRPTRCGSGLGGSMATHRRSGGRLVSSDPREHLSSSRQALELRGHHEIILVQPPDRVGPEHELDLVPMDVDVGVVPLLLGDLRHCFHE